MKVKLDRPPKDPASTWNALEARFVACRRVLHRWRTKLVNCGDTNLHGDFRTNHLTSSGRLHVSPEEGGLARRSYGVSFVPAARSRALKAIRRPIRGWAMHRRNDKTLDDLARIVNPYIRGWSNCYGHFYRSALYPTLNRVDAVPVRWACDKFKTPAPEAKTLQLRQHAVCPS